MVQGRLFSTPWGSILILTGLAATMAVNALVTSLIVFKILKVFFEVKVTSVERTLGSTGGTKLQHVTFVIIESGMALFAIQLLRFLLSSMDYAEVQIPIVHIVIPLVIPIHQMLNVIIRSVVHFYFLLVY